LIIRNAIDVLYIGLFSSIEEINFKTIEIIMILEKLEIGKKIIRKFSNFVLFIYQNLKSRLNSRIENKN
jgi:hypothetical protein